MNQRKEAMRLVAEKGFAVTEWNLYTDTHPNDAQGFLALRRAVAEYKGAKENYVNEYGPLVCTDISSVPWYENPWPWDYEGCGC